MTQAYSECAQRADLADIFTTSFWEMWRPANKTLNGACGKK